MKEIKMNSKRNKNLLKHGIAIVCASIISLPTLADNIIEGRVTDHSQSIYFEGAQVKLLELDLTTTSKRDGSFKFPQVSNGTYTLQIHYVGVKPVEKKITIDDKQGFNQNLIIGASNNNAMENIIVYGQLAAHASALARQKNADNLKSIVSADAIGQFPDQNAAEALQRLPGLFIQRDQGEGRFVGVRGIDPNLNNVTINGVNVPSPEEGVRSVALDVIPSELIQSLEVSKTLTPDMDANAIGGTIEVKSLSALDRENQSFSFNILGSHNELVDKTSPEISGSFTDKFELSSGTEIGIATALSWSKREFGSNSIETDGGWFTHEAEDSETGDDIEIFGAEEIEQRTYAITRERLGAALNIDVKTSPSDRYYLRTLMSDFSNDELRLRNEYQFDKGVIDAATATDSSAQYSDAKITRDTKDGEKVQKIVSIVTGGENEFDDWSIEYSLGYSKSNETEDDLIDADFGAKDLTIGYEIGKTPTLTQSSEAFDLSNFELNEVSYTNSKSEDEEISARIDVKKYISLIGENNELQFGVKYSNRNKKNVDKGIIYSGDFDEITADNFNDSTPQYSLGNFGPGINLANFRHFVEDNRANFEINQTESDAKNKGKSYTNDEDIFAAYVMITTDIEQWHIVTGLRYEKTSFSTSGYKVDAIVDEIDDSESVVIEPWKVNKDYDHLLPSLNVRYDINDNLVARFAYTNSIARPTFRDSAAFQSIETERTEDDDEIIIEREAEVGNPELDPYEAQNFDISIAYYPEEIGVLSAGIFHKDIDNFIAEQFVEDNGQWDGFEEVVQSVNGGKANVTGLEFAWTKSFDNGLILGLNSTFIDASSQLPYQSDTVGNLLIGYQNDDLSARLSFTHKSKSFQFNDEDIAVYEDKHNQLDFTLKYKIAPKIQLVFNAINIADEPYYLYHGLSNNNYQYEQYGRSFQIGISYKSF